MHITAYISLGGNMGDVPATFARARAALDEFPGIRVDAVSPFYYTEPQGDGNQPFFGNQVLRLVCAAGEGRGLEDGARELLGRTAALEDAFGRVRSAENRNAPRTLDIDILLYGDLVLHTPELTLPHPRMSSRAFVLVPLADIAPDLLLPQGVTVLRALRDVPNRRVEGGVIYQSPAT